MRSRKEAFIFFHLVGGVCRLFLYLALLAFTFLQLRRAEGEGVKSLDYIAFPPHTRNEKRVDLILRGLFPHPRGTYE